MTTIKELYNACKGYDELNDISQELYELIEYSEYNKKFVVSMQVLSNYQKKIDNVKAIQ